MVLDGVLDQDGDQALDRSGEDLGGVRDFHC